MQGHIEFSIDFLQLLAAQLLVYFILLFAGSTVVPFLELSIEVLDRSLPIESPRGEDVGEKGWVLIWEKLRQRLEFFGRKVIPYVVLSEYVSEGIQTQEGIGEGDVLALVVDGDVAVIEDDLLVAVEGVEILADLVGGPVQFALEELLEADMVLVEELLVGEGVVKMGHFKSYGHELIASQILPQSSISVFSSHHLVVLPFPHPHQPPVRIVQLPLPVLHVHLELPFVFPSFPPHQHSLPMFLVVEELALVRA